MKLLIASDIHGDHKSICQILAASAAEEADKILLLGDLLYHGPRNDLPPSYDPKAVIKNLNGNSNRFLAVRGNCDTEVDQMVLDFPILADYVCLYLDGLTIYATHGHKYNVENPLPMKNGDILLHGHTHIPTCQSFGNDNHYLNPGSAAIPKEGNPRTYMVYENRCFTVKDLDGNVIFEKKF